MCKRLELFLSWCILMVTHRARCGTLVSNWFPRILTHLASYTVSDTLTANSRRIPNKDRLQGRTPSAVVPAPSHTGEIAPPCGSFFVLIVRYCYYRCVQGC